MVWVGINILHPDFKALAKHASPQDVKRFMLETEIEGKNLNNVLQALGIASGSFSNIDYLLTIRYQELPI